jgi:hypothetical protein
MKYCLKRKKEKVGCTYRIQKLEWKEIFVTNVLISTMV